MTADALRRYAGTRALVLGATGFIGLHVARSLHRAGSRVFVAVREPTAAGTLSDELGTSAIVPFDAEDASAVDDLLTDVRPDVTFNLVGYGVDRDEREATRAERVNASFPGRLCAAVAGVRNASWNGVPLVHAGTQLEYGPLPRVDESAVEQPDTLYGETKLAGTRAIADIAAAQHMPTVVARIFTVYGPGEPPGRLLPSLVEAAIRGGDMPMTSGHQKTDFVHVQDVADGLLHLGLADAAPGTIVNLATGTLTSVREFASIAARLLGIDSERLRFGALPQRPERMAYAPVSLDRLRALAGWMPKLSVEEGIRRTIESYGMIHVED